MSAFVVSQDTIHAIVAFCINKRITRLYKPGTSARDISPREIGELLLNENVRSYNYRYKETGEETYILPPRIQIARVPSAVEVLKLCNCVAYQSCETDDWNTTDAYWMIDTIKDEAIRNLPGYEDAAWGY